MTGGIVAVSDVQCEAMAAVHRAAFGAEAWSAREIAVLFATPLVFGFLSEAGGMVMARAVADEAEILTIGVVPAMRRQGLARGLLDRVIAEARCRGGGRCFWRLRRGMRRRARFTAAPGSRSVVFAPITTVRGAMRWCSGGSFANDQHGAAIIEIEHVEQVVALIGGGAGNIGARIGSGESHQ
jgi:Acetyltransferase (GNAT) family.